MIEEPRRVAVFVRAVSSVKSQEGSRLGSCSVCKFGIWIAPVIVDKQLDDTGFDRICTVCLADEVTDMGTITEVQITPVDMTTRRAIDKPALVAKLDRINARTSVGDN